MKVIDKPVPSQHLKDEYSQLRRAFIIYSDLMHILRIDHGESAPDQYQTTNAEPQFRISTHLSPPMYFSFSKIVMLL